MTKHNFLQKRTRLLKAIRAASVDYLWHMNDKRPRNKASATSAAKRLMERSRDLYRLQAGDEYVGEQR